MDWSAKAPLIRALILDVDGVMTNGQIGYAAGEVVKFFDIRDGHAIKMALREGLLVGMLSGRADPVNRRRAAELDLSFVYDGEKNKNAALDRLLAEHGLQAEECLYMGDDVVDMPVLRRVGIGVCVADVAEEVRAAADWQTQAAGGRGAVRETIVQLLRAQGKWETAMARYMDTPRQEGQ